MRNQRTRRPKYFGVPNRSWPLKCALSRSKIEAQDREELIDRSRPRCQRQKEPGGCRLNSDVRDSQNGDIYSDVSIKMGVACDDLGVNHDGEVKRMEWEG